MNRIAALAIAVLIAQQCHANEPSSGEVFKVSEASQVYVSFSEEHRDALCDARSSQELARLLSTKSIDVLSPGFVVNVIGSDAESTKCQIEDRDGKSVAQAYIPTRYFARRGLTRVAPSFEESIGKRAKGIRFDNRAAEVFAYSLKNNARIAVNGVAGESLSVDGDSTFVDVPSLANFLRESTRRELTIAFWVKILDEKRINVLLDLRDSGKRLPSRVRIFYSGEQGLAFGVPGGEIRTRVPLANEWHHVAFTWDRDKLRIFVDGEYKAERMVDYVPLTADLIGSALCRIGSPTSGSRGPKNDRRCLKGNIDEFAIFPSALSVIDIQQLWQRGQSGKSVFD